MGDSIKIRGARQNNLKNLDLDLPLNQLIVVTGVSGSGKSSLVFDTLYAEGQRRYVETFSPYARQFLDRMDKPQVEHIEGVPPAIAIDQVNPVRTSRSTVGTMSEINDHLKLLYARAATLHCRQCGVPVRRDSAASIADDVTQRAGSAGDARLLITFAVPVPKRMAATEVRAELERQGYTRYLGENAREFVVVQDRLRAGAIERARLVEAIETALRLGHGQVAVHREAHGAPWRYSSGLHCAHCDLAYQDATPALFSFNSPIGACEHCKGFGRTIGIDYGLVIPDESRSLRAGAIKPWQTPAYKECQDDLLVFAKRRGFPVDTPWRELSATERQWVIDGEGSWTRKLKHWYGVRRFFDWLESKAYKMHVRVLLARYRSYTLCARCHGTRLKSEALLWKLPGTPPLHIHALQSLSLQDCRRYFAHWQPSSAVDAPARLLLDELRARLVYLTDVGLGYLTLDRQSRTLSGGEVQRINLTTALGTSLVNTLFVLDEPSIGLHPRDMHRIVGVLHRLRDAGNTLVVVEHDPMVMQAADELIDLGPGAGAAGGAIVARGTPAALARDERSLTGAWLSGRKQMISPARTPRQPELTSAVLHLRGARLHNLKDVELKIPLGQLVCITGVSGSGKSTLVQNLLYPALRKAKGLPAELHGAIELVAGVEVIDEVLLVDQSPIGRTTRSNPASYVGAFDEIRALFAATPDARLRRYSAGTFSFNSGKGRCAACAGNGFEHVEMQFLSDVYLRCGVCAGTRYNAATLTVRIGGTTQRQLNIAEVLELTVSEALSYFTHSPKLQARLQPLADVGLEYLRLGQAVPTLSGGEAQRLKIAGFLADSLTRKRNAERKLLIFDEPTTGLHFEDVAKLLAALGKLLAAGHSLLIIEHHLDVIRAADWVVELGPEGGDEGGRVVYAGTVAELARHPDSHTARALRQQFVAEPAVARVAQRSGRANAIEVRGAHQHNLKALDVDIPRERFTVITGVSGSGKSTLAFDVIFNEGQRRYLESLNAYARQFVQPAARAEVDAVRGIPPTVAIEQRASRGGLKSTVATLTESYHFLRLLYVHLGVQHCPECQIPVTPQSAEAIAAALCRAHRGRPVQLLAPLVAQRKGIYTDLARWAAARGVRQLRVDGAWVPSEPFPKLRRFIEHSVEMPVADCATASATDAALLTAIREALELGQGALLALDARGRTQVHSARRACAACGRGFAQPDPRLLSFNSPQGWCSACHGTGQLLAEWDESHSGEESTWLSARAAASECPACHGQRLNATALNLKLDGRSIAALTALTVDELHRWTDTLKLAEREALIARDALAEIRSRLSFLAQVGLGYLSLDRAAPTLSGGEAQRIRLAAQLGSNLRGVCYVLDEPTIGLHPRDNARLLTALDALARHGNTLIVVEHDEETIRRAEHIIDIGPGAGSRGGQLIAAGSVSEICQVAGSITGQMLKNPAVAPAQPRRAIERDTPTLRLQGIRMHNLRDVDVAIPLQRLVAVAGVSGSGKSTLARDVLFANLQQRARAPRGAAELVGVAQLNGAEQVQRVLEVDQTPIGRTPRSCPATYVGFWDDIRKLYAGSNEARARGFTASRFSFNSGDGRCSECEGQGQRTVEMNFLPDVKVRCERCAGARFNAETREVLWGGRSISDILALSVEQAAAVFAAHRRIHRCLQLLLDVGLGYLTLGQPSPTLSGGEAQRLKLVTELARLGDGGRGPPVHTLYVLDEPTVGLHMADVARLIEVLHRLADAGHSLVVVEHNLEVLAAADWIIDLGPEAGAGGGRIVAAGPPRRLAERAATSHTGAALQALYRRASPAAVHTAANVHAAPKALAERARSQQLR